MAPRGRSRKGGRARVEQVGPPRTIVTSPWNPLTLVFTGLTEKDKFTELHVDALRSVIVGQIGLSGLTSVLDIRLCEITIWAYPRTAGGASVVNVGAAFYSPILSVAGLPISVQEDLGTVMRPATLHYKWKAAERQVILNTTAKTLVSAVDSSLGDIPLLYHLMILWRSQDCDPVPTSGIRLVTRGVVKEQEGKASPSMPAQACGLEPRAEAGVDGYKSTGWRKWRC